MAESFYETAGKFEKCFSAKAAFRWFTAFIPGSILASDCGGALRHETNALPPCQLL
jgi:hypothetical protein